MIPVLDDDDDDHDDDHDHHRGDRGVDDADDDHDHDHGNDVSGAPCRWRRRERRGVWLASSP